MILAENIPAKLAKKILDAGAAILRCRPNDTAALREETGWGKTDDMDAILIWQLHERAPDKFRPWKGDPILIGLYRSFKEIQEERKRQGNRLWHKGEEIIEETKEALQVIEGNLLKRIAKELKEKPIWTRWMSEVKGLGPSLGGGIIGYIEKLGIENFATPSALWHYAGLHVENGHAPRREKGVAQDYNPKLKTVLLGNLADSFVKSGIRNTCSVCGEEVTSRERKEHPCQGSFIPFATTHYADIYRKEKARQLAREYPMGELAANFRGYKPADTKLRPLHVERRARRKAVKVFVLDTWLIWRAIEDLPLRGPWVLEHGGHHTFIEPPHCPPEILEKIRTAMRVPVEV